MRKQRGGFRPKYPSKRRWIARFRIGRPIPWLAMMTHPDLKRRCEPCRYLINMDAIRREAA